jgi:hypothetical protein
MPGRKAELLGQRFGILVVEELVGMSGKHQLWRARCTCGETVLARTNALRDGSRRTCGSERCRERRLFAEGCERTRWLGRLGGLRRHECQ